MDNGGDIMMITKKDKVEQFKRDLKSLNFYKSKRDELSDKMLELGRIMHEPKANRYELSIGVNKYNYIELMEKEDAYKAEYNLFDVLIKHIGEQLDCIVNLDDRNLIIEIYIRKSSFEKMAMERFISVRALKYHVDDVIQKIV